MNDTLFQPDGLLVLPRLRIQNANAISSPLTWGFPSPTAFLGFAHALERRLSERFGVAFGGVGIVCHAFDPQTFRPNRRQHLVFTQTRNPVYLKRDIAKFVAEGTPAAIVEEGRAHLEVSLVIAAVIVWGTWGLLKDTMRLALHGVPSGLGRGAQLHRRRPQRLAATWPAPGDPGRDGATPRDIEQRPEC